MLCTALLFACERHEARVYVEPRDGAPTPAASGSGPQVPEHAPRPRPQFTWTLPTGWEETGPGQMSAASFRVKEEAGEATVTITPLPSMAGKEAPIVNMWRQQVDAEPLSEADAAKSLSEVQVGEGKGLLFDVTGKHEGKPVRIVTAMVHVPDASWFYKLSGDEPVVQAQQPAFIEFLKSVRMHEPAPGAPGASAATEAPVEKPPETLP